MQEEIKEILDLMQEIVDENQDEFDYHKKLLDYITNLQNLCNKYEEEHKTTFEEWKKDIKANKKAIEYIETNEDYFNNYPLVNRKELLNILNGVDEE